ncbi:MAG: two-component sensor histidine kinase [Bacteroidetes bacterium]|nr:two-component sensor histidine kinase [Bacteroidota bacterium]
MNQHLQNILNLIKQDHQFSDEQKNNLYDSIKKVEKEIEIISFKLDRTEKVKRTTAILLEETIEELEQKRKAVEETNTALEKSMEELKAAQNQLIHSEKMASLGELTAGIAHEIQNPLNFVNNFSEVSVDLIDELNEEADTGNTEEIKAIAVDLKQNLEKIVHHGKRASGIVKGMLEHSRAGSGEKTPTDLNALADEYLRLAYHGLRAKEKSFNADFKLEADPDLPKVNVVPQDIGRVLLNLINNAFFAVSEKAKKNPDGYKPQVIVSTSISPLEGGQRGVLIRVRDNGPGIPEEIKDKIFQPFFTTKPTGQGTGLGLSLSYDIITKGHGGTIKVESGTGEGTTITIQIPVKN